MLDTDICIYVIKRKPERALQRLFASAPGDVLISAVTMAELLFGVEKSALRDRNAAALESFLLPLTVTPFDAAAANAYGRIRAELERSGTPLGALDTMIGAHAVSLQLPLATNNVREFSRIEALNVVDWTT